MAKLNGHGFKRKMRRLKMMSVDNSRRLAAWVRTEVNAARGHVLIGGDRKNYMHVDLQDRSDYYRWRNVIRITRSDKMIEHTGGGQALSRSALAVICIKKRKQSICMDLPASKWVDAMVRACGEVSQSHFLRETDETEG